MEEDEINYKNLRKIQQTEKNLPVLSEVQTGFYEKVFEYLDKLNNRLEKETSTQKQTLIKEEIQNTRSIIVNIYEQREKKILLAAISKARSGNPDINHMLDSEKNLFDSVLNLLQGSRGQFFEKKPKKSKEIKETEKIEPKEPEKIEPKKEEIIQEKQENTNPVLLIKKDMPEFIGTDTKKYNIRKDDVITMPENMSDMLIKRNIAEKIKW